MRISIITVVYNNKTTVASAIDSVLSQKGVDLEYIMIDGASTDGTLDIIRSYGNKITSVVSEPDKGLYDAMNKGIARATGEVIGILNSDDLYASERVLSAVMDYFEEHAGCDALYGDLEYVDAGNIERVARRWTSGHYKHKLFLYGWMPPHPTFFVKRSLYEKYGTFNTSLKSAADYELMLRFIHKFEVFPAYLPQLMVRMRNGGVSNARFSNRLAANREDRMAWKINGLKAYFFTTWLKPLRKVMQFVRK